MRTDRTHRRAGVAAADNGAVAAGNDAAHAAAGFRMEFERLVSEALPDLEPQDRLGVIGGFVDVGGHGNGKQEVER